MSGKLDINQIREILPHRYPFLLVDKVISVDPPPTGNSHVGRKIVAIKNVTVNEPFFNGHFPGKPIMPGVLIIEAMAQVAGILAYRPEPGGKMQTLLVSVDKAKFRKPVEPGDTIELRVEIIKDRNTMYTCQCEAYVENKLVAEAEVFAICTVTKEKK